MKKNAFTLLELLGVVIILGVLSLITFPIILNQIKNAKQGIKDSTKTLIIDAAKDYYEDNTNNYEKIEGMTYCIDIKTLTDNNYLNKNFKNENLNNIDTNKKVKLIFHNNKFDYDIKDTCQNNTLTRNNIEVPIVTENSGLYKSQTDTDRFIYRGGDPINNWIELNEGTEQTPNYVKYRIISFENDGTIKVLREASIGSYAWDKAGNRTVDNGNSYCTSSNGCNVWGNQDNTLYNGESLGDNFHYSYFTDMILTNGSSGTVSNISSLNDFLNSMTDDSARSWQPSINLDKYIEIHKFNVGSVYYVYNSNTYGDKGIETEKEEASLFTWMGKIGLPSITEFVESSTNLNCSSVYSNYSGNPNHDGWPCSINNYNYKTNLSHQWTINALSSVKNQVWFFNTNGNFGQWDNTNNKYGVRPAFYLKSSISLIGEGSETSPYRIVGES